MSHCKLSYSNLVDSDGNTVQVDDLEQVTESSDKCDYGEFIKYHEAFKEITDSLQTPDLFSSSDQIYATIHLAQTISVSSTWANCLDLTNSFFEELEYVETRPSTECQTPDDEPDWANDPCCNTDLQMKKCCRVTQLTTTFTEYTLPTGDNFDPFTHFENCNYPQCIVQPMKNMVRSASHTNLALCSKEREDANKNPLFLANPFDACLMRARDHKCFHRDSCATLPGSTCNPTTSLCTISCSTDADCFNGECIDGNCENLSELKSKQDEALYNCVIENLDQYLEVLLKYEVENVQTGTTMAEKFMSLVTEELCTSEADTFFQDPYMTKEECDAFLGICRPISTSIGAGFSALTDIHGNHPILTEKWCEDAILSDWTDGYCAFSTLDGINANAIGRPSVCEVTVETAIVDGAKNETLCYENGGEFWSAAPQTSFRPFGGCLLMSAAASEEDCHASAEGPGCLPTYQGGPCLNYCHDETKTTEAACGETAGTWYPNANGGACVMNYPMKVNCLNAGFQYVLGRNFQAAMYNTPQDCPEELCIGYPDFQLLLDTPVSECRKPSCTSCLTGNEPQCESEEACLNTQSCNNPTGCLMPDWLSAYVSVTLPCTYTPEGYCVVPYNKPLCAQMNFDWSDKDTFLDEESCVEARQICNNGAYDGSGRNSIDRLEQFTYRNQEECEACGGHIEPWYNWTQSQWIAANKVVRPIWVPKENVISRPFWGLQPSTRVFENVLERLRVKRLSSILASELYCKYGIQGDILKYTACSCGEGKDEEACEDYLTSLSGSPIIETSICKGIDVQKSFQDVEIVAENFEFESDLPCLGVKVDILPSAQFTFAGIKVTSSLALVSETENCRLSSIFVYNDNNVVVGQILSDGYVVSYQNDANFTGVEVCITVPDKDRVEWKLNSGEKERK
eukprot:TRINITY_DN525_c0_g3_i1.p1 TRINITY_DN525_c0_g3~~TRINITY_DN525_c0_g3_i1.p1  ORF type:complete len:911 (-),score=175.87 TRINITY_DN525_c0_g3_i1:1182-3914(-)